MKLKREGDEAAQMTEKSFNTAGQATVEGIHAVGIAATGTVKVAIKVGAAAATYDHYWKTLERASWKEGFMSSQDETLGPWVDRYEQLMYIPTLNIKTVEKVDSKVTKKALCFKIVTKSGAHFLSVECTNKEEKYGKATEEDVDSWMDVILNLARVCDGTVA